MTLEIPKTVRNFIAATVGTAMLTGGCASPETRLDTVAGPGHQTEMAIGAMVEEQVRQGKIALHNGNVKFDPNQSAPSPKASPAQPAAPQIAADELPTRR